MFTVECGKIKLDSEAFFGFFPFLTTSLNKFSTSLNRSPTITTRCHLQGIAYLTFDRGDTLPSFFWFYPILNWMKQIIVQIVNNDHGNNFVKFEKDSPLNLSIWIINLAFLPIDINGNLYFTQNWYGETFQKFTHCFNSQKANFSDKN